MDYDYLRSLQKDNPAVKLLRAENMPMMAGFLYEIFVKQNRQTVPYTELIDELNYYLEDVRLIEGDGRYVQSAQAYVDEWIGNDQGILRKYRTSESDEPICDIVSSCMKALSWMEQLKSREFVGTESRLKVVIGLLDELLQGTFERPEDTILRLQKERENLNQQIAILERGGRLSISEVSIREKAILLEENVRTLVGDFREVEGNFRTLSKKIRLRLVGNEQSKGAVLDDVLRDQSDINDSDEGQSFEAFFELIMRGDLQQKLSYDLKKLMSLSVTKSVVGDSTVLSGLSSRMLTSAKKVSNTKTQINEQLARFIRESRGDSRRLTGLIDDFKGLVKKCTEEEQWIESALRLEFDVEGCGIELDPTMSLRLFSPNQDVEVVDKFEQDSTSLDEVDLSPLLDVTSVDEAELLANIHRSLSDRAHVSLERVIADTPITQGLEEALYYLKIAADGLFRAHIYEQNKVCLSWESDGVKHELMVPNITFFKGV